MADGLDIDLRKDLPKEQPPDNRPLLRRAIDWCIDLVQSWGPAILIVLVIRSILIEPFQIPSGSMVPTLAIGDFILVSKLAYGLRVPFTNIEILPRGEPERGDIVVFIHPPTQNPDPWCKLKRIPAWISGGALPGPREDCETDYIKRVVGLPGDTVEVRDDVVFVNGVEQTRTFQAGYSYTDQFCRSDDMRMFEEVLDGKPHPVLQSTTYAQRMADWGPKTVPDGEYFMMGDNRDNSADSRVWGFVPRDNIKGRAMFVWLSFNGCEGTIRALGSIRTERIGTILH
ncbi:MAG: signal peptidase I [Pseudomonadota bacterium]|nr:signal peptidase I [Pseudomonadota bacterium]